VGEVGRQERTFLWAFCCLRHGADHSAGLTTPPPLDTPATRALAGGLGDDSDAPPPHFGAGAGALD